jgi:hypothetical protein
MFTAAGRRALTAALACLALAALAAWPGAAQAAPAGAGVITTVAGGVGGPGPAVRVAVPFPLGVSFGAGSLYISQVHVRAVSEATGRLTTPAGLFDTQGPVLDGGPAAQANLDAANTAVDKAGNLLIADVHHNRVRVAAATAGTFYGPAPPA